MIAFWDMHKNVDYQSEVYFEYIYVEYTGSILQPIELRRSILQVLYYFDIILCHIL